jgi:hypothetical protein
MKFFPSRKANKARSEMFDTARCACSAKNSWTGWPAIPLIF